MSRLTVFAHTHWDREWFERADTAKPLLIGLFENLYRTVEKDPAYYFILDGQTVILQDYLSQLPWIEKKNAVRRLKACAKNLSWGPFYGQIDWRIAEESAIAVLEEGMRQAKVFGQPFRVGWLLDNFGFASQVPQILNAFGIRHAVVWRGVPLEEPATAFSWVSPDGSRLNVVYVLDSYRNLMRIGDYPEVALKRVRLAVRRLQPYSRSETLPLFNGYDLDPKPENPSDFGDFVSADSQAVFARQVFIADEPIIRGELRSGRYACVFPGSLSTRIHLKQMHRILEDMLSRQLQPLNSLLWVLGGVRRSFRKEWQALLQNLIHDSIGGVGTDVVHQEMETRYRSLFDRCMSARQHLLEGLSPYFSEGYYLWNLQPLPVTVVQTLEDRYCVCSITGGRLEKTDPVFEPLITQEQKIERFVWHNEHYDLFVEGGRATLSQKSGDKRVIRFSVFEDEGDTYTSAFTREAPYQTVDMTTYQRSRSYESVKIQFENPLIRWEWVIGCDHTPVIKMKATLQGRGVGYALILTLEGAGNLTVYSPFDAFERKPYDVIEEPAQAWQPFLVAARETGKGTEFSFKDFVGYRQKGVMTGWLSPLYGYTTVDNGAGLILLRSVDFLSKPEVPGRIGDAGPYMYTPGAAMKGEIAHGFSLFCGKDEDFPKWKSAFSTPPILFHSEANPSEGGEVSDIPSLSLGFYEGGYAECTTAIPLPPQNRSEARKIGFRFYNPGTAPIPLRSALELHACGVRGDRTAPFAGVIEPKTIETVGLTLPINDHPIRNIRSLSILSPVLNWVRTPVASPPDPLKIQELVRLRDEQEAISNRYEKEGREIPGLNFQSRFAYYKAKRTALELSLSLCQNMRPTTARDPEIQKVFLELNDLRIKRRSIELLIETLKSEV
ncbi:MAG TPA: hypothetical protein PLO55_09735 [Thermotogota bacterium]|nr:hypothetical protein [Thermotogota bacterium]